MTRPVRLPSARTAARLWFAAQALGGAAWWVAVPTIPAVRIATLGSLDPLPVALLDVPLFVVGSALAAARIRWAAVVAASWTLLVAVALAGYATVTTEAGIGVVIMAVAALGSLVACALLLLGRLPTRWALIGPFAARPADADAATSRHVLATAGQIVVFWGFFLLVVPLAIRWLKMRWRVAVPLPAAALPVGIVVPVLASALGIWSAAAMSTRGGGTPLPAATATRLVIAGPYRFVRNPMALAGVTQAAAVGLMLGSWLVVAYAVIGSSLWNHIVRPGEEADLEARFGDPFRRYRAAVRCWVPTFPGVEATRR
ncbi:methyltransferase family protein [Clavibacter zhangzhiyongii]|uniref:Isoprenylcysteine carboxylmethyltransferase family protein n=1 Tax=Clavibacter zhangzhiyongii TaxID=2768071 RepID=A0A7L7Z1T3_9MICO|nr:isoprenylcysteine carboxylmethyltransferase family protein [Clavibacter zhangzhiyongii]QOD43690.1 isoprenylcysteine carboxylmethyltransferase family protein [Clavibacter zhangzhiyongii]